MFLVLLLRLSLRITRKVERTLWPAVRIALPTSLASFRPQTNPARDAMQQTSFANLQVVADLKLLLLISVANSVPVIAKNIFGHRLSFPVDGGALFSDRKPLLGASKTFRGIVLSLLVTPLAALAVGIDWTIGVLVGLTAMAGDLLSSFLKRRANAPVSSMAIGLDQLPESLLPAIACAGPLGLSLLDIVLVCAAFLSGELLLSRVLYAVGLRDRPY